MEWVVALIWLGAFVAVAAWWLAERRRSAAVDRLNQSAEAERLPEIQAGRRLRRMWQWVPWAIAFGVGGSLWLLFALQPVYIVSTVIMMGLLGAQVESFLAARHAARLERQLADAIDIMIGAVGAGSSVGAALEAAVTESSKPLRPFLEEVTGRIRLGDTPSSVFSSLADRVPLETFLLFTSALAVHWEVGGRLTSTLTTVARTIRDRIEVSRRIRSNTAQSQFSTMALIALTYFIALIVYNNGPGQMREFVTSTIGSYFVAGAALLQAVGIAWMNLISKPRF